MLIDAATLSGTSHNYVFPDFSGVAGFDARWVPPSSTTETVNLGGTAHTLQQNGGTEVITRSSLSGTYRVVP